MDKNNSNLNYKIEKILNDIIIESKCTEQELDVLELKLKTRDRVILKGYSYKAYNNVWFRLIINMKDVYRLEINNIDDLYTELLNNKKYNINKIKENFIQVDIPKDETKLLEFLKDIKQNLINSYLYMCNHEIVEAYGCCSRFIECSDERECVNHDKKDAKGCAYRKNLLAGKIFYGKNKNI